MPNTSIGALPGVPSAAAGIPSPLTEFGSALGALPDMMQQQQGERLKGEVQNQEYGQKLLANLANRISSDPTALHDPSLIHQADQITRQSGLPSVTSRDASGQETLNQNALTPNPLSGIDDKTLLDLQGADPAGRLALLQAKGINVNDPRVQSFLKMPQNVSLNPAMVDAAMRNATQLTEKWQAGLMDPAAYAASIKALGSSGLPPSAVEGLTDTTVLKSGISQFASAKIAAIPAEIAAKVDMTKLRSRMEDDAMTRFNKSLGVKESEFAVTSTEKNRLDTATIARDAALSQASLANAQRARATAGQAGQLLQGRLQLLQLQIQKAGISNKAAVGKLTADTKKNVLDAEKALNTLDNNIATQLNSNSADPASADMQALFAQRTSLQNLINQAGPVVSQGAAQSQNATGSTVQAVTGNHAQGQGGNDGGSPKQTGKFSNGLKGYSQNGKYFLDNGTEVDQNGNTK